MKTTGTLSDIWLKASVVGSLWASVEIIIGSFFHNLRIPMAGTILAMISVVIMVAFHQLWKEKGLFWRAGLICALMKSISPSAILLGPMTGIFAEALLMEIFTRLFGANFIGYIIGGAMALASTIAHKIINLLIIYGFDFVTVLVNLYEFAVGQIGYPGLKPELALWILFGIYAVLGIAASLTGMVLGRNPKTRDMDGSKTFDIRSSQRRDLFSLDPGQQFSVKLLFFHLFAIAVSLVVLNAIGFIVGLAFIAVYVMFCLIQYKRSMRHLKRPFFWVQVLVLTFLATLFYNGFSSGNVFDPEGLLVGIRMNVRAVLILVGFSAISVELRNPLVKTMLWKRGFSQLYLSLGMAFSALPSIIDQFVRPRQLLRKPGRHISQILLQADDLLNVFKSQLMKPKVIIISGEKHHGKTTFALNLAAALKKNGKQTAGFCAHGQFESNRRSAFEILSMESGDRKPLCSIHGGDGEEIGPFRFYEAGQQFGRSLLEPATLPNGAYVFIDEVGPLEMKDRGWAPAIEELMDQPRLKLVMIVRKSLVSEVMEKWKLTNVMVLEIDKVKVEEAVKRV
ncbi:MAG: nucleoside-triphosphatase [Bacteroidales bacterium]